MGRPDAQLLGLGSHRHAAGLHEVQRQAVHLLAVEIDIRIGSHHGRAQRVPDIFHRLIRLAELMQNADFLHGAGVTDLVHDPPEPVEVSNTDLVEVVAVDVPEVKICIAEIMILLSVLDIRADEKVRP